MSQTETIAKGPVMAKDDQQFRDQWEAEAWVALEGKPMIRRQEPTCLVCGTRHLQHPDPVCKTCGRSGPRCDPLHSCPDCHEPSGGKR